MLEIKNLSKSFGNQQVLDHISLKIEKGKAIIDVGGINTPYPMPPTSIIAFCSSIAANSPFTYEIIFLFL